MGRSHIGALDAAEIFSNPKTALRDLHEKKTEGCKCLDNDDKK